MEQIERSGEEVFWQCRLLALTAIFVLNTFIQSCVFYGVLRGRFGFATEYKVIFNENW